MGGQDYVGDARRLWTLFEPVHAVTYFAPEARDAFEEVNLRGFWRGYFAGRAAPLGPVGPGPVTALFFNFAPAMVTRALPEVWNRATPEQALRARADGATAALRRTAQDAGIDTGTLDQAVGLLEAAVEELTWGGRALGAANAALPLPDDPFTRLWHATTVLREHRGDGHIAALVASGVDGCEVLVWRTAVDGSDGALQRYRGWTDEEWDAARRRLAERGWLDARGEVTATGRDAYAAVEAVTDRTAEAPWRALGPQRMDRLAQCLGPFARAAATLLPYPNPIGVPAPALA